MEQWSKNCNDNKVLKESEELRKEEEKALQKYFCWVSDGWECDGEVKELRKAIQWEIN